MLLDRISNHRTVFARSASALGFPMRHAINIATPTIIAMATANPLNHAPQNWSLVPWKM